MQKSVEKALQRLSDFHQEIEAKWPTRTYRPCPDRCGECEPCLVFAKVIKDIDLNHRSPSERQRAAVIRER